MYVPIAYNLENTKMRNNKINITYSHESKTNFINTVITFLLDFYQVFNSVHT